MKLSELVTQAQKKLPLYTDYFSNKISVASLSAEGNICTLQTAENTPHGLEVGQSFIIEGAKIQNNIKSLTQSHGLGVLVTEAPHQVTKNSPLRKGDSTHITIYGANEEAYNGTFLIMDIPNANVIEFSIDKNAPNTATGTPYLKEDCYANYNGRQIVDTVISETELTFKLPKAPMAENAIGDIFIRAGVRISGEYSIEHAIESYEANADGQLWGFCVLSGANISKSRINHTDALATVLKGSDLRIDLIQDFDFFVIIPTTSDYCWIDFVDIANELRKPILKTFHRAKLDSDLTDEDTYLAFVGDQPVDTTTKAFMVYDYKFQNTINICNEDGIDAEFEPAIRKLNMYNKDNLGTEDAIQMFTEGDIPEKML